MWERYELVARFVQQFAPGWRKTQVVNLALLVGALLERPCLCLTELARAYPGAGPLHGRLKRLERFLSNPRLDELALAARFVKLAYRLGDEPPDQPAERPLLPVLLDTTYFDPFAALIASVPCGGRALPLGWATYHRQTLLACLPPRASWPERGAPLGSRSGRPAEEPPAARAARFLSQNHIEEALIELVWRLLSTAIRAVLVADRGFARASLFRRLNAQGWDWVIRMDADTHVWLPEAASSRPVAEALSVQPGERQWVEGAAYHKEERVPVNLLAVWDAGQEAPWYLATRLERADWTERMYRWRMRIECSNRDEKTGVLLRQGGDDHRLTSPLHVHRLLLGLMVAHWLCALTGLEAHADLPQPTLPAEEPVPGPAQPPPAIPHRGEPPPLPNWMRRFAARSHLSYVRLGLEVLRAPDLVHILCRLIRWLAAHFRCWLPLWRPRQRRLRLLHGFLAPP